MLSRLVSLARRVRPAAAAALALAVGVLTLLLAVARAGWGAAERAVTSWVLPPSASGVEEAPVPAVLRGRTARGAREIAVCAAVVLLVGVGAASTAAPASPPVAVQAAAEAPVETRERPAAPRTGAPDDEGRAEARILPPELNLPTAPSAPAPPPVVEHEPEPVVEEPAERWLPTGTGMWLHDWVRTENGDAPAVVAKAKAAGFTHLFVQTGSTKKGWIGEEVLSELLPATKGKDLAVIAWDFPKLIDPEADAQRLVDAATWRRPGVPRVAAVAPDVETRAEGTHISAEAVTRYYSTLRSKLPPEVAILATVPWPSEKRIGSYPYHATDPFTDAWIPMAYWYNRDPGTVTATSMQWLSRFGKPVMPVGQGYDGRLDAPYLPPDPDPAASVQAFVDAARAGGARSISLWSWQTTDVPQWATLGKASWQPWPAL